MFEAFKINLFEKLGENVMDCNRIADLTGTDTHHLKRILRALAAMGILTRNQDLYSCEPGFLEFVIPGREKNLSHFARLMGEDFASGIWTKIGGQENTQKLPLQVTDESPGRTGLFTMAMQNLSLIGEAEALNNQLNLTGRQKLLDIGGGSGSYSIALCKRHPGLTALVVDLPDVIPITRKIIVENEIDDRIGVLASDWSQVSFKKEFDVVLLSDVLYNSEEESRKLIALSKDSIEDGGMIAIRGYFLDDTDTRLFPALFDINLMMHNPENRNPSIEEVVNWLEAEGFIDIQSEPITEMSYLITAIKPSEDDSKK